MKTLFAVFLLFICYRVMGDTVTYQSQTMPGTNTLVDGAYTNVQQINDVYMVTVTLAGPLAPNLNMAMVTPQSWTVVCQSCVMALSSSPTATPSPPLIYLFASSAIFLFSTDATGKIIAWNFAITANSTVGLYETNADGSTSFAVDSANTGSFNSGDSGISEQQNGQHFYTVTTSGPKGIWTQSSLSNPAPAVTLLARTCNGTWDTPNNNVAGGLTPNASGAGMNCRVPRNYPSSWYIKVTPDNGKTVQFVTMKSLGLGY